MGNRWKKISGTTNYLKWQDINQCLEGIWLGQHDGKFGPNGVIKTVDGEKTFSIHTALISALEDIKEGTLIKIIYLGKQLNKNTGREFKAFDVFVNEQENEVEEI